MARLVGVDLPREKRMEIALTYIFGMGRTRAAQTLAATGISRPRVASAARAAPLAVRNSRRRR